LSAGISGHSDTHSSLTILWKTLIKGRDNDISLLTVETKQNKKSLLIVDTSCVLGTV
jgi:hypothetical protein